jgi:hypothetical protein
MSAPPFSSTSIEGLHVIPPRSERYPVKANSVEIGIATVYDGSENYRCAMPLWCATATEVHRLIPSSEVMVFGPAPPEDCPKARWVWGDIGRETLAAAKRYLDDHKIGGSWSYLKEPALLKVAMMGMTEYRLLLYGASLPTHEPTPLPCCPGPGPYRPMRPSPGTLGAMPPSQVMSSVHSRPRCGLAATRTFWRLAADGLAMELEHPSLYGLPRALRG